MRPVALEPVVVEAMAGRHIVAVHAIDKSCYSAPWSSATWRRELADASRNHLIARVGDEVVGHAGSMLVADELHITTVAVHPDHQGGGIATRLVLALLDHAGSTPAAAATLEVRATARRTQRLYGRFGFRPAGIRPGYYRDPTDDAVIMWLHDLGGAESAARIDRVRAELAGGDGRSAAGETT